MTATTGPLTAKETFTLQVEFCSDWHIGSGTGCPGDVDRLVQRDRHNLPYIPAKTLTGMWRDACERVAYGLDDGRADGVWQQWVTYLFGDQPADLERDLAKAANPPRPAALSVRSAHLPVALQDALIPRRSLHDAICIVKPGIKIDEETGCAKSDCLRLEERVRGGAVLTAACRLHLPQDKASQEAVYALLVAGTQFVERMGGKRRRGSGKCRCFIAGETTNGWIDCIASNWVEKEQPPLPPEPEDPDSSPAASFELPESKPEATWVCFDIAIAARSPLVVATRTIGNVVESLDYIPGSHLLGLIAGQLRRSGLMDGQAIQQAIAQRDLIVTPATVEIDGEPGRPAPLCWAADKVAGGLRKGGTVYNWFVESSPAGVQLKAERGYYVGAARDGVVPSTARVAKGIATHNIIEDRVQRPTERVGGVFSYEAIAPNTRFRAQLRVRYPLAHRIKQAYRDRQSREPKTSNWWSILGGPNRIGISKKDDYGAVAISACEAKSKSAKISSDALLHVWLLSDLLLRDERLRFSTQVKHLQKELSKALGVEENKLKLPAHTPYAAQKNSRLESWQSRWGLPRPSLVGIQAGSCFVFEVEGTLDPATLRKVEIEGIGDRTVEGYGQVCFNDPLVASATSQLQQPRSPEERNAEALPLLSEDAEGFEYARIIEREAWRDAIRRRSLELAADPENRERWLHWVSTNPPNSQLGALNSILRQLRSESDGDRQLVCNWLEKIRATPNRLEKWQAGEDSKALSEIESFVTDRAKIWETLTFTPETTEPITLTVAGTEDLRRELWAEAVRVFVDACIRAHRRDAERLTIAESQGANDGTES